MRMRHIVTCCLTGSKILFHNYLINGMIFGGKVFFNTQFGFLYNVYLKYHEKQ